MNETYLSELIKIIIEFRDARGWQENDKPENLAKSIIIEAAELLENFQWGDKSINEENLKEELADVIIYSLSLAHELDYDVFKIIIDKLNKNAIKYPIEK